MTIEEEITAQFADAFEAIREDRALLNRYPLIKALELPEDKAVRLARIVDAARRREGLQ